MKNPKKIPDEGVKIAELFKQPVHKPLTITPTLTGGFIVKIGCAMLAFTTPEQLAEALTLYLLHPEDVEYAYNMNKDMPSNIALNYGPGGIQ